MSRVDEAEIKAMQAATAALSILAFQVAQGRGTGFFSNLKYKVFGSKTPEPLPEGKKPPP